MTSNSNLNFKKYVVNKPWGCEYIAYQNKECSVGLLKIKKQQETSLHCHPKKKNGLIIIDGEAEVELGFYDKKKLISPSKIMIRPGLFHSTKCISKTDCTILEIESPVNKMDLVRFKDQYGREQQPYEGLHNMRKLTENEVIFEDPINQMGKKYFFGNVVVSIEKHENLKKIIKEKSDTIFAIIERGLIDKNKNYVLSAGDIVRTDTIKKLAEAFNTNEYMKILKIKNVQ
jgi:mannose-6-phosphate isomerase-like protein (cupin superfamily)